MNEYIKNSIKGFTTGALMSVPGVSGGTVAAFLGIYNRLLESVGCLRKSFKTNLIFLLTVGISGFLGIYTASLLISPLFERFEDYIRLFFCGAVPMMGYHYFMSSNRSNSKFRHLIHFIIGFTIPLMLLFLPSELVEINSWYLLLISGIPLSAALILPGISTTHMLLSMSLYEEAIRAIADLDLSFLMPLLAGILIGCILFSKLLTLFCKRYPLAFIYMITGFVVSSIFTILPKDAGSIGLLERTLFPLLGASSVYLIQHILRTGENL